MSKAQIRFVLDGFPRSGSTSVARLLNQHPHIRCCIEPFHPQKFGGSFHRMCVEAGSVSQALHLLSLRWGGLKHVWEPETGWPFIGHRKLNDSLVMKASIVVSLRRRNLLRQCVSNYLSKHLGFWVGDREEFYRRLNNTYIPPLNIKAMSQMLDSAVAAEKRRDELLNVIQSKTITLFYEDVFAETNSLSDKTAFCSWLVSALEYPPLSPTYIEEHCLQFLDAAYFKWSSMDIYARIPGSHALDKELGNSVTGFLFQ